MPQKINLTMIACGDDLIFQIDRTFDKVIFHQELEATLREKLLIELEQRRDPMTGEILLTTLDLGKNNSKFKRELEKHSDKKLVLSLKGKKENRHCIDSLIGIRYSKQESKYYIGLLENIPESTEKASPIREAHGYKGNNFLDIILPMLNEYFVKNGSFTVLPYPIKYIKEYYRFEGGFFNINKLASKIPSKYVACEEIQDVIGKEII